MKGGGAGRGHMTIGGAWCWAVDNRRLCNYLHEHKVGMFAGPTTICELLLAITRQVITATP